jgi:hypothetical protein
MAVELAGKFSRRVPLSRCDEVLYCQDADRWLTLAGKRYAPILDSYQDSGLAQGRTFVTLSPFLSEWVGERAYGRVLHAGFFATGAFVLAGVLDKTLVRRMGGVELKTRMNRRRYARILRRTKPQRVVGIQPNAELLWAARELGIESVDIQHGDICGGVPYYLPARRVEDEAERIVPDRFLVWDEPSARVIRQLAGRHRTVSTVTGNLWLERHKRGGSPYLESYFAAQNARAVALVPRGPAPAILVTLQWDLSELHPDFFVKRRFFADALFDAICMRHDVTWVVRPHPLMADNVTFRAEVALLVREGAKIVLAWPSEVSLPALLSVCQLHVTWHSSTVIEALELGVPSLVLSPESYCYTELGMDNKRLALPYTDYESTGLVYRPRSGLQRGAREILELIDSTLLNTKMVGTSL